MRDLRNLDSYRLRSKVAQDILGDYGDHGNGIFEVLFRGRFLRVIATNDEGWDHVSVSLHNRTPTWTEMEFVKRLFFEPHEYAMQLHVPPTQHVNCHPYCLHLWRPQAVPIPVPPKELVGGLL